jgi:hypothetical protein
MRFFGADVITSLKTIATSNLNTMIDLIKTERSDTGVESIKRIDSGNFQRQYPECMINLGDSLVESEELNLDISDTPEIYPVDVLIALAINSDKITLRQEYYIEALERIYHGYKDINISWISVMDCIRVNAYTEQNELLRVVGVKLSVRIL